MVAIRKLCRFGLKQDNGVWIILTKIIKDFTVILTACTLKANFMSGVKYVKEALKKGILEKVREP